MFKGSCNLSWIIIVVASWEFILKLIIFVRWLEELLKLLHHLILHHWIHLKLLVIWLVLRIKRLGIHNEKSLLIKQIIYFQILFCFDINNKIGFISFPSA